MRFKPTYNFLGGGCLYCYRGIFSSLSNETVGAASYIYFEHVAEHNASHCQDMYITLLASYIAGFSTLKKSLYLKKSSLLRPIKNCFISQKHRSWKLFSNFKRNLKKNVQKEIKAVLERKSTQHFFQNEIAGVASILKFDLHNRCCYDQFHPLSNRPPLNTISFIALHPLTKNMKKVSLF